MRKTSTFLSLSVLAISVLVQQPHQAMACPVGGCTNANFYGDYALSASSNGSTPNIAVVGVFHADGAGNFTGQQTNIDDSTNPVNVVGPLYICNSTYSIASDGTGTMSVNVYTDVACTIGPVATPTIALVLEDGGRAVRTVNTNGSIVITGTARLQ